MLSFLPRWDYCWKCEFDTDVQMENCYHHDGKQLGFHKKSTYQNTEQKASYCKKRIILKRTSHAIFNMKTVDLDES